MQNETASSKPTFVRLELTSEQRTQVRASTGVSIDAIELSAQELEERIAPRPCAGGQHLPEGTLTV
jgi:hypothetical protein